MGRTQSIFTMNTRTWRGPWQSACAFLPCAWLCMALAAPAPGRAQDSSRVAPAAEARPITLGQALEAAWQRSLEATESRGRQARAQADQALSQSWWAGAPALSLGQREGGAGAPAASRETELGLALPLWRLGQRDASGQVAQSQSAWAGATEKAERLRLAGRVREAMGALQLAETELHQAQQHAEALGQLAEDIQRRVRAGDLAPADAHAARAEWLAAQVQASAARQTLGLQQAQWRLLTGLPPVKLQVSASPTQTRIPDTHPELLLANAAVDLGQRRVDAARVQRTDSPELTLGMRQERPGQGAGSQNSVVMGIRVPVGGQVYQQPHIAAALAELDVAKTQAQRTRERLEAELALAQSQLSLSLAQLQAERERAALLGERARWIDKSFRTGETALPDMLRALAAAASAQSAHARQHIHHQLANARLEQALGWLP